MAIDTRAVRAVTTGRPGIPPLSQSRYSDMACDSLYFHKHVQGVRAADSEAAARGIEIHRILATYLNHLTATRRATDLEALDTLIKGAGDEARAVLERFRENHILDPQKILATELHIALGKNFRPIENLRGEAQPAEYEGTLDLVMLGSFTDAEIHDWKSYYQIIVPDTFQSKFYPLLLMCLNPSLERVKFVLEFVRYGVSRSVEYAQKDLPWLKELAQRERAQQIKLHEIDPVGGRELKASPGRHCTWCPLLLKGCPVAQANPYQAAEKLGNCATKQRMMRPMPHARNRRAAESRLQLHFSGPAGAERPSAAADPHDG